VTPAGIDTFAVTYRRQGGTEFMRHVEDLPSHATKTGLRLVDVKLGKSGARLFLAPRWFSVKVEGRLGAILYDNENCHDLVGRDGLEQVGDLLRQRVGHAVGWEPDGNGAVSRLDLTAEREFEQREDGMAFIRGVAALCPPGYKRKIITTADGRMETGYVITPKRAIALTRVYDKSEQTRTGLPGERVRLEAQNRFDGRDASPPGWWAKRDLSPYFGRRWTPYLDQGKDVTVTSTTTAVDLLAQKVARDELSPAKAERIAGSLLFLERCGRAFYGSNDASSRRLRAARQAGIAIDNELPPGATLPVGQLLREMVDSFCA
jgi:hypothetical protein